MTDCGMDVGVVTGGEKASFSATSGSQTTPLHVLEVEDDADTANIMAMILRREGYEIELARDGSMALALALTHMPDVVLLDIGLPGMTGYEVAERLKAMDGGKHLFIIAITGYGTAADRQRSAWAGIDLHLLKPVDIDQLLHLLTRFQRVVK